MAIYVPDDQAQRAAELGESVFRRSTTGLLDTARDVVSSQRPRTSATLGGASAPVPFPAGALSFLGQSAGGVSPVGPFSPALTFTPQFNPFRSAFANRDTALTQNLLPTAPSFVNPNDFRNLLLTNELARRPFRPQPVQPQPFPRPSGPFGGAIPQTPTPGAGFPSPRGGGFDVGRFLVNALATLDRPIGLSQSEGGALPDFARPRSFDLGIAATGGALAGLRPTSAAIRAAQALTRPGLRDVARSPGATFAGLLGEEIGTRGALPFTTEAAESLGLPGELGLLPAAIGGVGAFDVAETGLRTARAAPGAARRAGVRAIEEGIAPPGVDALVRSVEQFDPNRTVARVPQTIGRELPRGGDEFGTINISQADDDAGFLKATEDFRELDGDRALIENRLFELDDLLSLRKAGAERRSGRSVLMNSQGTVDMANRAAEQGGLGRRAKPSADAIRNRRGLLGDDGSANALRARIDHLEQMMQAQPQPPSRVRAESAAAAPANVRRPTTRRTPEVIEDLPAEGPPTFEEFRRAADPDPTGGARIPPRGRQPGLLDAEGPSPTPQPPEALLEEVGKLASKGEAGRPVLTLLRRHAGALGAAQNQARILRDQGTDLIRPLHPGRNVGDQPIWQATDQLAPDFTMDDLFRALHGEIPADQVPAAARPLYDEARRLTDWEEGFRLDFDPDQATVEDYFYRGWRPPDDVVRGISDRGRFGQTPAFRKARADMTYSELRELGFEPLSWNPFEQWRISRMQGVRYRQQMSLLEWLKGLDEARPHTGGPTPDGWRVARIGRAMEGVPVGDGLRSRMYVVRNDTARRLENMYGREPDLGTVGVGGREIDLLKVVDFLAFVPKRAKLFASFFQQKDFVTRAAIGGWTRAVDDLRAGQPIEAVKAVIAIPPEIVRVLQANVSEQTRRNLRTTLASTEPLVEGRSGVHLRGIMEAGLSNIDVTTGITDDLLPAAREVGNELGVLGQSRRVLRIVQNWETAMRRGLFEGIYPAAQIQDIQHNIARMVVRANPNLSDEAINGEIARIVNLKYSTIPADQSVIQNQVVRAFLRRVMFSTGESEALLRQALETVPFTGRQNKSFWVKHFVGAYAALIGTANVIHFASTGEPLPLERYTPIAKTDFGPFPIGYNRDFAAPNIPFTGRNGTQLTLDLMDQLDTAFRVLDPVGFLESRESVPVRAFQTQAEARDFYGRPIDQVGPGGVLSRTAQLLIDVGAPIGPGQAGLEFARTRIPGASSVIGETESRIGDTGQALQAPGFNVRAATNQQFRDTFAREHGAEVVQNPLRRINGWDDLTPPEQVELRNRFPEFDRELDLRRRTAGTRDQITQAEIELVDRRDQALAQAFANFGQDPQQWDQYRRAVSGIGAEARGGREVLDGLRDHEFSSNNAVQQHTDRFFAFFDASQDPEQRLPGETPDEAFDRMEAELMLEIGRQAYEDVLRNIYTVRLDDAPPVYQRLQETKFVLAVSDFWNHKEQAYAALRTHPGLANRDLPATLGQYRDDLVAQVKAHPALRGANEARVKSEIAKAIAGDDIGQLVNDQVAILRDDWTRKFPQAAQDAFLFGYWRPRQQHLDILDQALAVPSP